MLRQQGTEAPRTGEYYTFFPKEGYFACRACKHPLYEAGSKFKDCGKLRAGSAMHVCVLDRLAFPPPSQGFPGHLPCVKVPLPLS